MANRNAEILETKFGDGFTCTCGSKLGKADFIPCEPDGSDTDAGEFWEYNYRCPKCSQIYEFTID